MLVSPTIQHLHGRIFTYIGADPDAGAEAIITVPARRRWKVHSIHQELVTDITEEDRTCAIIIDDGTNILLAFSSLVAQTASTTKHYYFAHIGAPEINILLISTNPMPELILAPGSRIRTATNGLQAGDNYGAPIFLIEEWIDP